MTSTPRKAGRKPKTYLTSDNRTIDGLMRQPDGRWKIIASGVRFTEPDERLAVAHYLRLTGSEPAADALLLATTEPERYGPKLAPLVREFQKLTERDDGSDLIALIDPAVFWARVRKELLARPKWVAKQVGIEQIGYLTDLRPPDKLPTFDEMQNVWREHCSASDEQRRKVLHDWADFVKSSKVATLTDITPECVIAYRDEVYRRGITPKAQQNLFTRIRRMVSFAKSRAMAMEETGRALLHLGLLVPSDTTVSLDPQPISKSDYNALLSAVKTDDDRAMILLMLNCAMYLAEVVRLKWSDIDHGCIITHRKKTGRCVRVAVLWPETLQALEKMNRKGDHLFMTYAGAPIGPKGAERRFRMVRIRADVPHVTSSQLRDGAYTAAVEANVTTQLCQLLVGHRTGIADHYVKRKPTMVAPACEAIRRAYLPGTTL